MYKNIFKDDEWKRAEHMAVRETVGYYLFTHQLMEVTGPDASRFLDYIYPNKISTLKVGRDRYTTMLNEEGEIIDDVVVMRMDEERYWVSTLYATKADDWFYYHSDDFDVDCSEITEDWHMFSIQGPLSKDVMNSQDNATRQKIHQAMIAIAKAFYAKDCGEMVNTSLGWLTHVVFVSLCTKAAMTEGNPVENFRNLFSAITAGGEKSYKLSDVTKRVDGVPDEDAVTDEPTEEVPVENPEPANEPEDDEEEMPTVIPAEPSEKPKQSKPASKRKKVNFAKLAELLDSDASEDSENELEENPVSKDAQ